MYYPPTKDVAVIYDEIDQMIGKNSVELLIDDESGGEFIRYVPEVLKKWGSVIAFSGTVSDMLVE